MTREIEILMRAAAKDCAVVEKSSHALWTTEELARASQAGCYPDEDQLAPPSDSPTISTPFPGCMQQHSRPAAFEHYRLVGKTEHFLIFAMPVDASARASSCHGI